MTATIPEHKVRKPRFDENAHPRDRKGRFIEIGARVSVWGAGGTTGIVERNLGGGRIAVRREGDGKVVSIHRNYLTVTARPDGAEPTDKPEDKPAAAPPETDAPDVTPPAEAPDRGDTTGPAPLDEDRLARARSSTTAPGRRYINARRAPGGGEGFVYDLSERREGGPRLLYRGRTEEESRRWLGTSEDEAARVEQYVRDGEPTVKPPIPDAATATASPAGRRFASVAAVRAHWEAGGDQGLDVPEVAKRFSGNAGDTLRFLIDQPEGDFTLSPGGGLIVQSRRSGSRQYHTLLHSGSGSGLGQDAFTTKADAVAFARRLESNGGLPFDADYATLSAAISNFPGGGSAARDSLKALRTAFDAEDPRERRRIGPVKPKPTPKPKPAVEALRADLRARAETPGDAERSRRQTILADKPDLYPVPDSNLVVSKGIKGTGFIVSHVGTGLSLGTLGSGFKTSKQALDFAGRITAERDSNGNAPLPDTANGKEAVAWSGTDGENLGLVTLRVRADWDRAQGLTTSDAITSMDARGRPVVPPPPAATLGSEVRARVEGDAWIVDVGNGDTLTVAPDGASNAGRVIDLRSFDGDGADPKQSLADGVITGSSMLGYRLTPLAMERARATATPPEVAPEPEPVVSPQRQVLDTAPDGSTLVLDPDRSAADADEGSYASNQRYAVLDGAGVEIFRGPEIRARATFERRRPAPEVAPATEIVPVGDLKPGDRLDYRAGEPTVTIVERLPDGTDRFGRTTVRFQGRLPDGREGPILFGPTGTALRLRDDAAPAPAPLPTDLLATPDNLAAMSDADLAARSEALRQEILARRTSNTGPRRRERDAFVAARSPIDAEIDRRSDERQRAEDEANGIVNRDRMTNPEAVASLVASLPEADRQGLEDLSERVDAYLEAIQTSLPERPQPGEDGLDPIARRQIQIERDRATDVADGMWANLDDDLGILFERVEANGDADDVNDVDVVIASLTEQGEEAGYDVSRGDRRRRRTAMRAADLDTLRGEYQGVRGYGREQTDLRQDYAEEFERRGLMSDGSPEPVLDEDGKDAVRDAADEVGDAVGLERNPTADLVTGTADAYAAEIGEDAGSPSAAAVGADLDDAIDSALRDASSERLRDALEALRRTIRPEHRVSGEIPGQTSITDDLTDEPLLRPAPTPVPVAGPTRLGDPLRPDQMTQNGVYDVYLGNRYIGRGVFTGFGTEGGSDGRTFRRLGSQETFFASSVMDVHRANMNPDPDPSPTDPPPVPAPVEAPAYSLEDSTWGSLQVGDRFVDSSGEGEVVARNEDGSLDVRRPDGVVGEESGDDTEVVQIARALSASEIASLLPPPRPHERGTAVSRPSLPTSRRRIINGYALDTDPAQPLRVREAAARLRNRQPLSADESAALRDALRGIATNPDTPARRAQALQRAAGSLDIASTSAAVNLGGGGRRKRPANAGLVRRLVPGSRVRIPATQGYDDTEGTVLSVKQEGRTAVRTLTIRTEDGRVVTRSLLGGTYIESREGFGEPIQDVVPVGDLKPGDRVTFGDGNAATITGVRVVADDPDVALVSYTETGGTQVDDLPFGRNVQASRLYGPDAAPPPEPEDEGPRVGTASEIGVGDIIAGTYGDTGNGFTMRITEVTPLLGGTKYRVIGEMNNGNESGTTYAADEAITFLPPLPEDAPLPTPKVVEVETIGPFGIRPGDRITIPNSTTGRGVRGVVDYVDEVEGEGDDGQSIPGVRIGLFNGFSTTTYDVYGDEQVTRSGNAGATYAADAARERRVNEIAGVLEAEAQKVEAAALAGVARVVSNAMSDYTPGGTLPSQQFAVLGDLSRARGIIADNAQRGQGMTRPDLRRASDALLGANPDDAARRNAEARIAFLHVQIADAAVTKAIKGLEEAGISDLDPSVDYERIRRLLRAVEPSREWGQGEDEDARGLRRQMDTVSDYSEEFRLIASTAPVLGPQAATPVDPDRPDVPKPDSRPLKARMADYKAALPPVFGTGEVEVTEYADAFVLSDLREGKAPALTKVRRPKVDVAADGGPTADTLAQLEVVKAAGREVYAEVTRRVRLEVDGPGAEEIIKAEAEVERLSQAISALGNERRSALMGERTDGKWTDFEAAMENLKQTREAGNTPDADFLAAYRSVAFDVSQEPEYAALLEDHSAANRRLKDLQAAQPGRYTAEDRARLDAETQAAREYRDEVMEREVNVAVYRLSKGRYADAETARASGRFGGQEQAREVMDLLSLAREEARNNKPYLNAAEAFTRAVEDARTARTSERDRMSRLVTARARASAAVIAEFREIGPQGPDSTMRYTGLTEKAESVKGLRWAEQFYPTEWLEKASKVTLTAKTVSRGYYSVGTRTIALSAKGDGAVEGSGKFGQVAVHELGHHMEEYVPGVMAAEEAYLWSRTTDAGTEVGARTRVKGKNRLKNMTKGKRPEKAHEDEWNSYYTGRSYVHEGIPGWEVFTTGAESIFGGAQYVYGDRYGQPVDEDFAAFMYGTMALL